MEAILNAEPESLSVNQLKSVLFENGEFIPQVPTPKATFVQMFRDLQKKVSANPDGHWQASILTDSSPFAFSRRRGQKQQFHFSSPPPPPPQQTSSPSHPVTRNRTSGFDIRTTNVTSVVVPFPPSTPEQSRNESFDELPQSSPNGNPSQNTAMSSVEDEQPMKPSCRLESVYYVRRDENSSNNTIVNNFNGESERNNDGIIDDDDNNNGGIFMVQSPPSSDDDILLSEDDNSYNNNDYDEGGYDDNDDNIHEHPNFEVQDSFSDIIWNKFKSIFVVVLIIVFVLLVVYKYVYLHPFDVWGRMIPNNSALSKELLLKQVSRILDYEMGSSEVCGWGDGYMKGEDLINSERKDRVWDDVSSDDLRRYGINFLAGIYQYFSSNDRAVFPSMCFFYERFGQISKILLCVLLFVLSRRLARRMN